MFLICRLVAVLCFLIAAYSGTRDVEIYFDTGRYVGITVAELWSTYARDSFFAFQRSLMPDTPALRLLIDDALQQPAWAVFLILAAVIFFLCGRRRQRHSASRRY